MNRCIYVYVCVYVGWDRSHTHNDEEHRSGNVSHVNRVDDEGYGLARFHANPNILLGVLPFNCLEVVRIPMATRRQCHGNATVKPL